MEKERGSEKAYSTPCKANKPTKPKLSNQERADLRHFLDTRARWFQGGDQSGNGELKDHPKPLLTLSTLGMHTACNLRHVNETCLHRDRTGFQPPPPPPPAKSTKLSSSTLGGSEITRQVERLRWKNKRHAAPVWERGCRDQRWGRSNAGWFRTAYWGCTTTCWYRRKL